LGFGASSRPDIHYSFHQMAQNTKALLDHGGFQRVHVIAHSKGGMLGVRFTLLFPDVVEKLVLENPIGLEDYRIRFRASLPTRTGQYWTDWCASHRILFGYVELS
jgi:pimeloyl-ACP methyl ester carboxylesterase